jgi:methylenetetrahydrofolate dehydrogenase (NADP+)/methenyltetrahydrofolate cyclohydrolase
MKIDGKKIADEILEDCSKFEKPKKFFSAVLVGDDSASISFLRQKEIVAKKLGIDFRIFKFPSQIKNDELRKEVFKIASHKTCGGVIVQLPLPSHLNQHYILNVIPVEKDVDVLSERALGAFYVGRSKVLPPAVGVVKHICEKQNYDISSFRVGIVGLGILVGRPIANWIMRKAKETILLRSVSDLSLLKDVDLVITGVGKALMLKPNMLKDDAIVIDFGYGVDEKSDKLISKGDFDYEKLSDETNISYTPTPRGTGPVLVAKLFENFLILNSLE